MGFALQEKAVLIGFQLQIVAQADGGNDDAHFLGESFAHAGDALEQIAALARVGQADQAEAQFDLQGVHREEALQFVARAGGGGSPGRRGAVGFGGGFAGLEGWFLAVQLIGERAHNGGEAKKRQHGQPRHDGKNHHHSRQDGQHFGKGEQLAGQFLAQFLLGGGAGDEDAGGGGGDERGNLRDQAVPDGEQGEPLEGFVDGHALLHDADGKAAQDIDEGDQNGGDGVAADEFARPVHGPVKIGFLLDLAAAEAGLGFVDHAGVEFGVNRHLFARHGVEGETGRDFGDAPRALGDDDEIDQGQNQEDHQADDIIAADDKIAEGFNDMPGIAVEQDQAGGSDVERKAVQGDK